MFIKNLDRESLLLLTFTFTFFQSTFCPVMAQSSNNVKASPKHSSKTATTHSKSTNSANSITPPTFHRRQGKLSADEIKAFGQDANKFYRLAEQKEKAGKLDEAKEFYYKSAVYRSDVWGHNDPAVAKIAIKIGKIEVEQKHPQVARTWFKQASKALSIRYGSGDYELVPVLTLLAKLEAGENDHSAASSYYEHILRLQERKFGEDNPEEVPIRISYIEELIADKDPNEAEEIAKKAIEIEKKARGAASQDLSKFEQLLAGAKAARASNSSK